MHPKTSQQFYAHLSDFSREDDIEKRKAIEKTILDNYGIKGAVLILDMSGFSLLTQKHGIVHYLSLVNRMRITSEPIINSHGGDVIKFEADNCYAVFSNTASAIQASIDLNHAFSASNILAPEELDINISIGIDYGNILIIEENDLFGNPVNRASKLGEDISDPGEILVTKEAMNEVSDEAGITGDLLNMSISGIKIDIYRINY